jgi:sugar lactone lactonase YvrE
MLGFAVGCASSPTKSSSANTAAPKGSYAFWPTAPDEPRIQFIRSFDSSDDLSATQQSGLEQVVFGKDAEKAADVNKPYGVAMHAGKVYVCDMRAGSLVVLDLAKKQTRLVGTGGANRLQHPVAVAVADDGTIFVADNQRDAILVFDASERYTTTYGIPKFKPVSLAVHGDRLYCCDMASQSVQIFNAKTGDHIGSFGSVGDEDGQFRLPLGVACDVWVVDMMRCRVQKFSPEGKFIFGMGTLGDSAGTFARPKHIAVDTDGIVYVVDASFQNVQMFDNKGQVLMAFGAAGDFPGSMNLPAGICVTNDSVDLFKDEIHPGFTGKRLVVVTNQFGPNKVSVYAMGGRREGYTVQALATSAVKVNAGTATGKNEMSFQEVGGKDPVIGDKIGGSVGVSKPADAPPAVDTPAKK